MAAHALLGPSSAKRWMTCPLSARLGELYPDEESEFAKEGTAAHEYADLWLLGDKMAMYQFKHLNEYYGGEMEDAVEVYVNEVLRRYAEAQARSSDALLMPEQYLVFDKWVPEGFGTGDVTIISKGILEIIDLKYGKGVPVFAHNNPQTRIYGLGAYDMYGLLYDIHTIRMTIIQPRLDSITSEDISVEKLLYWTNEVVVPAALNAWNGVGVQVAGRHCRFCKVKPDCIPYKELPADQRGHMVRDNTIEDAINDFK